MKHLSSLFLLIFLALIGFYAYHFFTDRPVSIREFERKHKFLNRRIDTLQNNQRQMIRNQKVIYRNQQVLRDSLVSMSRQIRLLRGQIDCLQSQVEMLHYGQTVIYDAVTSPEPSRSTESKFKQLIDWFSGK